MEDVFEVGSVKAKKGAKATGFLHVGETTIMEVRIPVAIFHGVSDGPVLCISGGVHGYEYSSIEAVQRIFGLIDPAKLSGTVVVVPVVNPPSFESRGPQGGWSNAFQCPIDGININRIFPGNPEGTMGYQIAYVFMSQVIPKIDFLIDCHGGDLNEELSPYVIVGAGGDKEKTKGLEILAASYDTDLVSISTSKGGSCFAASQLGKPAIVAEAGGFGRLDENAVRWHVDGMLNVMKRLKMIVGTPNKPREQRIRKRYNLIVKRGGICYSPQLGVRVKKGDQIGQVKDMFGNVVETVTSPVDGVVSFRRNSLSINSNDRILGLTPDEDITPPERPYP